MAMFHARVGIQLLPTTSMILSSSSAHSKDSLLKDGVRLQWRSEVSLGHACAGLGPMHSLWDALLDVTL